MSAESGALISAVKAFGQPKPSHFLVRIRIRSPMVERHCRGAQPAEPAETRRLLTSNAQRRSARHRPRPSPAEETGCSILTLSFDNGPEPASRPAFWTPLADAASARRYPSRPASSCSAAASPRDRREGHAEGHWIANHTWTHPVPLGDRQQESGIRSRSCHRKSWAISPMNGNSSGHSASSIAQFPAADRQSAIYLRDQKSALRVVEPGRRRMDRVRGWVERVAGKCRERTGPLLMLPRPADWRHEAPARYLRPRRRTSGARFRQGLSIRLRADPRRQGHRPARSLRDRRLGRSGGGVACPNRWR